MKIWDLVRAVRAHSDVSGSGNVRPRLLLQHEILPLEDQKRDLLPFNLVKKKRSKEVVNPVSQHQSNQQTMEGRPGGLSINKQTQFHLKQRQENAYARQPFYQQPKVSLINRVEVRKRFSQFRELNKREEQTNALERPGKYIIAMLSHANANQEFVHMIFSSDVSQFLRTYRGDRPC